jgi:di-N-acetylchitobiase
VRVVWLADLPAAQLLNSTYTDAWVAAQVSFVVQNSLDGINVDMEDPITDSKTSLAFTKVVGSLTEQMHAAIQGSQVSVDLAWSPDCIDNRCYDYLGLSQASDFSFIMSYDTRSQIWDTGNCIAAANSPLPGVQAGYQNFTAVGVNPAQMILGVPWYGYDYQCAAGTGQQDFLCPIAHVPYQGAPCSDAAGSQIDFSKITAMIKQVRGRVKLN